MDKKFPLGVIKDNCHCFQNKPQHLSCMALGRTFPVTQRGCPDFGFPPVDPLLCCCSLLSGPRSLSLFLKKSFLFYIGVQLINNVVIVSGVQQREIAIHIHISPFLQAPLPTSLPHNIGQNFMCCTIDPCWCREFGIDMYTLLYFKWINSKDQISFIFI